MDERPIQWEQAEKGYKAKIEQDRLTFEEIKDNRENDAYEQSVDDEISE